jgi:hypothetical protein
MPLAMATVSVLLLLLLPPPELVAALVLEPLQAAARPSPSNAGIIASVRDTRLGSMVGSPVRDVRVRFRFGGSERRTIR